MPNPTQTMAVGKTLSAPDYGDFGSPGLNTVATPAYAFGQVVGATGSGKSSLYRGYAGALDVNFDCHSCPKWSKDAPPPKCRYFPVKNEQGRLVDMQGNPVTLKWDHFDALFVQLFKAAAANKPRPTTIVMDTVAMMVPLYREYIARTKFAKYGGTIESIPEGNLGMKAWGLVYDGLTKLFMDLMFAGYGVHLLGHLQDYHYNVPGEGGQTVVKTRVDHNIPDRLYDRYSPALEFYIGIENVIESTPIKVNGKVKGMKHESKYYLINKDSKLHEKARSRVSLPDRILLPDPDKAFECFQQAYRDAS